MGKLRHIAFISQEPKKLSDFYQKHFGFEECKVFPSGSRMVIDPLFNLAFLQSRGDQAGPLVGTHRADGAELERLPGIHHYGFFVENLNEAVAKLPASLSRGTSPQVSAEVGGPEEARPAEIRFVDPWGNNVDLSARGFLGREEKRLPGVRLLAVQVPDLAAACEFYQRQFDLEIVGWTGDGTVRLSDATVTLLLIKTQVCPKRARAILRYSSGRSGDSEEAAYKKAASQFRRKGAEVIQFLDPESNRAVVSQTGWTARLL